MIVTPATGSLRLVTQGDHAHLAAEILSLVRRPELVEHPRRSRLLRGVREHDNGWRELDAAPSVDRRSGRPQHFRSLPDAERRELWDRGARRLMDDDPYVCLLVVRHARELHHSRRGEPTWSDWLEKLDTLEKDLLEASALTAAELAADHRWLAIADSLSLALGEEAPQRFQAGDFSARLDGLTLRLSPFPLAGRTTFRLSCRHIPDRAYADDRELGRTLARAPWERVDVALDARSTASDG